MSVALAGHFQLDLYIINLAAFTNGDSALADTFETIPRKCMVLLEDIDSAGIKRENIRQEEGPHNMLSLQGKGRRAPKPRNPITLSGLLNAIDGATSQEGRVLIMTTNDPEALDDALIRPGRVDMQVFFGPVSQKIAEAIFVRMYTKDSRDSALSTSSVEPSSEQYSLFAKLLSNLRSVSWWRVLVAWIIPPTWAATAVHYHFGFEIIISKLLLGVCIYTTIAMVVLVSLAIYLEKIGPTTNGAATLLNSALRGESPVPSNSSMTSIERSGLREMAGVFGTRIPENRFTPAEVQGFLLMNMEHPDAALANIDGWVARLLAAKDCGTNIIPEEPPLDNALKPIVGQPSTPPNSGNKKNKQLATATQGSDPSDQSVVFLEGSPSSHIFPSATRGYKKLTAYFCYNPKGAATSAEEKQRQQNTVQYFQQASKALEAIDGKEAVPSSRYQLSRRITVSPTRNEADPGPSRLREESLSGEDDEGTDDDSEGGPVLSPGALARLREISRRQAETTAERIRRGGARPANLNFSRVSRAELEDDGDE
ncbi:hypothetical protein MMC34_000778 [Xylographa carneopallida]|nr:hypothetical protein [Xylographa carneopallida]